MKVVLDTNALVAAFIAHGVCNELLEHCALNHTLILSPFILDELEEKLRLKFGFTAEETNRAVRLLESRATLVSPQGLESPICRDSD